MRRCDASVNPSRRHHDDFGDATIADAILDRLLSRSHRLSLKGKSMRPSKTADNNTEASDTITLHDAGAA